MTITYHPEVIQGDENWYAMRRGRLTASEMKLILTPTLKVADNDKTRAHLYELLAQRVTGHVEPTYVSEDMLRGQTDEIEARNLYAKHFAPVEECGFITNDRWGFTIGYSPDALVGDDGLIECKSRRQKYQAQTIIEGVVPDEYMLQLQTGLLVSERAWIDFISICGGMPLFKVRVYPIPEIQSAIIEAATKFEEKLAAKLVDYQLGCSGLIMTERRVEQEMFV